MKHLILSILITLFPAIASAEWLVVECSAYTPYDCGEITASGEPVRVGGVACNFLPLGTWVTIDGVDYVVNDRCGIDDCIDIFMLNHENALEFGRRYKEVYIHR